jgi:hypothetical protein
VPIFHAIDAAVFLNARYTGLLGMVGMRQDFSWGRLQIDLEVWRDRSSDAFRGVSMVLLCWGCTASQGGHFLVALVATDLHTSQHLCCERGSAVPWDWIMCA